MEPQMSFPYPKGINFGGNDYSGLFQGNESDGMFFLVGDADVG